jgi:ribonucleoside-diphosphate reductase beta chain
MSVLNFKNTNYISGKYPLFLGQELCLNDEINVTYPEIESIKNRQQSAFWLSSEYSFEDDRVDLQEAPTSESDVMILNLLAQMALDSLASRSIIELFGPLVSNPEMHSWFLVQSFFEDIHAATYSRIIRSACVDSQSVLERGMNNLEVFERTKKIADVFNEMKKITGEHMYKGSVENTYTVRKALLKAVFALYALEQISFNASFAATFALAETGKYQTIGQAVSAIAADETMHAEGDLIVFNCMIREDDYAEIFEHHKDEFRDLFVAITQQEHNWSEYIFSDGRKILGLNEHLLKEYVNYVAAPCYKNLGFEWEQSFGEVPASNPLPYLDKYLNRDSVAAAPQEIQVNNYRVGQVDDDISDDEEFDF